ncbi:MAG: hypothetical protein ABH986_06140 [archaeon]
MPPKKRAPTTAPKKITREQIATQKLNKAKQKLALRKKKAEIRKVNRQGRTKFGMIVRTGLITAGTLVAAAGADYLLQQYAPELRQAVLQQGEKILIQIPSEFLSNVADSVFAKKWNIVGAGAGGFVAAKTADYFGRKANLKQGTIRIWKTILSPIGMYLGWPHYIIASAVAIPVGFKKPRQILMKWTGRRWKALKKFTGKKWGNRKKSKEVSE